MDGRITHFRRGKRTQHTHQMIVLLPNVTTKAQAQALLNKNLIWKSPAGKEIKGVVMSTHGNKGALRVHFEKGMPGQAIGTKVVLQ